MKSIKQVYLALVICLTILWLIADQSFSNDYEFFALRYAMMNYTGIIGMGVMSVAMILAIRPKLFEIRLGGLDKSYRLHKWLGITGLVFAITHYFWANVPKWMIDLGFLDMPERGMPPEETVAIFRFLDQ